MRKERRRQMISDLNLTNLIDVMLVLLIVFMITAPMMTQGIQVDLPRVDAGNVESSRTIQVTIDADRTIFVDAEKVPLLYFKKRFTAIFAGRTSVPVFISADSRVPYGFVIQVIGEIQQVGVVKLGFLTQPTGKIKPAQ